MEELGITQTNRLVSIFANIEEHWVWILFSENDEGKVNVNIRSIHVPIRDLASKYGGGGHDFAAGAVIEKHQIQKLVDDADRIVEVTKKHISIPDMLMSHDYLELEREKESLNSIRESKYLLEEVKEELQREVVFVDEEEQE